MKYLLPILLLLTACENNRSPVLVYEYLYNDEVMVKEGFYKGQKGYVSDYIPTSPIRYGVNIDFSGNIQYFYANEIERIK